MRGAHSLQELGANTAPCEVGFRGTGAGFAIQQHSGEEVKLRLIFYLVSTIPCTSRPESPTSSMLFRGELVEVTPAGQQIATKTVDTGGGPPPGAGDLFGTLAVPDRVYFVDDGTNTLDVLQ